MNESLFFLIHGLAGRSSLLDSLFVFFAEMLGPLMIVFLLLLPFAFRIQKMRQAWTWVAFISLAALVARFGLTEIIRAFYPTSRPFVVLPEVVPLIEHATTNAFPSGHAVFYFALAAGVSIWMNKISSRNSSWTPKIMEALYIMGAFLVGVSRVVAGVHWPYDIMAGAIIGIAMVCGLYALIRKRFLADSTIA